MRKKTEKDIRENLLTDEVIGELVRMLREEYKKAIRWKYIGSPLCFALYRVWKNIDERINGKNE